MQKRYISSVIEDDYRNWELGRIAIDAGTGAGKTTFIMNVLLPYAIQQSGDYHCADPCTRVRILYLCNRVPLKSQIIQAVFGDGKEHWVDEYDRLKWEMEDCLNFQYIDVWTYQKIQREYKKSPEDLKRVLDRYTYIICDEAHYFVGDSDFNDDTKLAYLCVEKMVSSKVVVYMSATMQLFLDQWRDDGTLSETKYYALPKQDGCVKELRFYYRDRERDLLIESIPADEKILLFVTRRSTLENLKKQYGDKIRCYCSANNRGGAMDKLSDCIDRDGRLKSQILAATTALYNGVDIKDRTLKHIFIEQSDPLEVIQEIGRKRPTDEGDTCKLYLRGKGSKELVYLVTQCGNKLEPAFSYLKGAETWGRFLALPDANERINASSTLNYDHRTQTYSVNEMKMRLWTHRREVYLRMKNEGYAEVMKEWVWKQLAGDVQEFKFEGLEIYIRLHLNIPMPKEKLREDLIRWGNIEPLKGRSRNEPLGRKRLNHILKVYGVKIKAAQGSSGEWRNKTYWMLIKLN